MRSFVITFCALLSLTGCRHPDTGALVDPELAAYVPASANGVAGIDLEALKHAALYQKFASRLNLPLDVTQRFGVNPQRDLTAALFLADQGKLIALARGSFSDKDVQQRLLTQGAGSESYKGATLLIRGEGGVFFPEPGIAASGSVTALRRLIDNGTPKALPEALAARLRSLPHQDQIWASVAGPFPISKLPIRSDISSLATSLAGFVTVATLGVGVDTGLHVDARLQCVSEKGAEQVQQAFRGMIGFARLGTDTAQKDLLALYDSIQVDQDKSSIHVHSDLSPEVSERLLNRAIERKPN